MMDDQCRDNFLQLQQPNRKTSTVVLSSLVRGRDDFIHLFDIAALHNCGKCISKLMHDHLGHIRTGCTWYITIANAVFSNKDVVT